MTKIQVIIALPRNCSQKRSPAKTGTSSAIAPTASNTRTRTA